MRVANAATTWDIEGVDTTNFGTFSSGSSEKITFGTTLSSATDVTASGGDPEFADITTISDNQRKQTPVITSPFSISFECLFDPADAALIALKAAADNIAQRALIQIACLATLRADAEGLADVVVTIAAAQGWVYLNRTAAFEPESEIYVAAIDVQLQE